MSHLPHSLDPLFHPKSIAVVGASASTSAVGGILIHNLLANPFGGVVYPINPKRHAVHGVRCYPSITALPEVVDLAVIATPAATVPGVIEECIAKGIRSAIIISAGFSELGQEGRQLEGRIRTIAKGKMRIIGPNCLGVIHPPSNLNASFAATMAKPGKVALLSQSVAICTSILDWATTKHFGFSSFVSVGAMLDVDFADLIDYFAEEPNTRSIVLYMESIGDVRKFLSAARAASRIKHVIVVKAGRHEAGAKAAASHTGALAGSNDAIDSAFRRAGVLRVTTIPELFDMSEILATQPPPLGPRLAIITNAGGPGVMATDALMTDGGQLASLSPDSIAALNKVLPPFWSHANPIDVLGDATPERYRQAVEICAKDENIDGLMILLTPQAMTDPTETARQLTTFAHLGKKPVLACWMGGQSVEAGRAILGQAGMPTFDSPESTIRAFLHMVQYRRNQELLYETPEAILEDQPNDSDRVRAIFRTVRDEKRTLLTEAEAKDVLAAYGLPVVPTLVCHTADEAAKAASKVGFPVVVKLLSRTVTHKSDVGGVQLNLANEQAVRNAFETIRTNLVGHGHLNDFDGVTVQPMVRGKGYELIVGSTVDAQLGPVMLFGTGGILVEVFKDRALGLPPLTRTLARRLMERTKIYTALQGVRGQKSVNLAALETLLVRFSQLLADFPEIKESDINPLLATPENITALDARILLSKEGEELPRLALPAYPNQYTTRFRTRDGREVTLRVIRPEDEPLVIAMHATHSEQTIRMRYFSLVKTLSRDTLIRLCHLDYNREMALVAVVTENGQTKMVGVSRFYLHPESGDAEFAVIVNDAWQGQGLGQHLMERLIAMARERGVRRLVGLVLAENNSMLHLMDELAFQREESGEQGVVKVTLTLT